MYGQITLLGGVSVVGVLSKAFLAYSATGRSLSARGSSAAISGTANNFASMNAIHIGYLSTRLVPFSGHIGSLVYYPTRLFSSEIKLLSAYKAGLGFRNPPPELPGIPATPPT